jgi:Lambda phage tail tube protein, TTP
MSNTYIASQTVISQKIPPASTYTSVGRVDSFDGPSFQVASIETTALQDTAKTYRPGIPDSGEMSFQLQFDPTDAAQIAIKSLVENPAVRSFQISFPTDPATLFTFDGFPTAFKITGGGPEEVITADCTIKITGVVDVAAAS